jgi:NAD(P)-dependent dehydrogenase (short-subunit alcohol dehydrogenase family)
VKVLVAGASGFVGRRLCPALADDGHDVVAMTRNPAGYAGAGAPVYGDVRDPGTPPLIGKASLPEQARRRGLWRTRPHAMPISPQTAEVRIVEGRGASSQLPLRQHG